MNRPPRLALLLPFTALALGLFAFIVARGVGAGRVEADTPAAPSIVPTHAAPGSRTAPLPPSPSSRAAATPDQSGVGRPGGDAPPMPRSLRGTDVDGRFDIDVDGHFRPTHRALRVFDYFLSAVGEVSMDTIRALVRAHALESLPPEEVEAALRLFDLYIAYQERSLSLGTVEAGDLEGHFERLKALQVEVFGDEEAEDVFGRQNALADVTLARRELMLDESLDDSARAEALDALEEELPDDLRAARESMTAPARVRAEVESLREAGASESQVFATREAYFGAEAASRLGALDARRADWDARMASYRGERDALLAGASGDALESELSRLRAARFDATESLRVAALDRIELER